MTASARLPPAWSMATWKGEAPYIMWYLQRVRGVRGERGMKGG
jgi:hypothetical protein